MKKENNFLKGLLVFSGIILWIAGVCAVVYNIFNKYFKISIELSSDSKCDDCTGDDDCNCDECSDKDDEIEFVMGDDVKD